MGRTCCRFLSPRLKLLRQSSTLDVLQSRNKGNNGPSKCFCLSGVVFRRTCSTQEDRNLLSTEQTNPLKIPEEDPLKPSQELINENTNNAYDCALSESYEEDEDTSDPCAELDFNNMTNENVEESKIPNEFAEESLEDERFPLPSEPLDKG